MNNKTLLQHHRDNLCASGLTDETIDASGIYSATSAQVKQILHLEEYAGPGMVIPYGDGFERVRLDIDDDEGKHYRTQKSERNRIYFAHNLDKAVLSDEREMIYIVEGEKKALAMNQHGLPTISIAGVYSWRTRHKGEGRVPPEFDGIVWKNRRVVIVFDSDIAWKPNVRDAEEGLADELANRGANVQAKRFPNNGAKIAADDYLKEQGRDAFDALPIEHLRDKKLHCASEKEIDTMQFRTPQPLVAELIPGGLAILAAKSKVGKTWMTYQLSRAVATGEPFLGFPTTRGEVCYLALEESAESVQHRRRSLGLEPVDGIRFVFHAPVMRHGFIASLTDHLETFPKTRLVVIDTMACIRDAYERNTDHRDQDHRFGSALQSVAQRFGVTIAINHHFTKGVSADFADDIAGTTSLTASASVILGLSRARGASEGVLRVMGWKVKDRDIPLEFRDCRWYRDETERKIQELGERTDIVSYLWGTGDGVERTLAEIANGTGLPKPQIVKWLNRLEGDYTQKVGYGKYKALKSPWVSGK
jgi:hypothetical protein